MKNEDNKNNKFQSQSIFSNSSQNNIWSNTNKQYNHYYNNNIAPNIK